MKGSAGQKRVPKDFFDRYKVVAPSIALQIQFAERCQKMNSSISCAKSGANIDIYEVSRVLWNSFKTCCPIKYIVLNRSQLMHALAVSPSS